MITHISPAGSMDLLSQIEVERLKKTASSDLYQLYRNCTLAVLNSGSHTDNSEQLLEKYQSFDVSVMRRERGIKLELNNALNTRSWMARSFEVSKNTYFQCYVTLCTSICTWQTTND